jgi:multicomponent Na+:H+ antiporter subunit A
MPLVLIVGFLTVLAAPLLHRIGRRNAGWVIALVPLAFSIYFATLVGPVSSGELWIGSYSWVPGLGINLSFYVDGLSLLMALIISGIGALVTVYAGGYLAGHPQLGLFYAYLMLFMTAMLGVVLAGNLISLFVFWELTSISSYLLIGFKHEYKSSRAAALQALLVTGGGGLALLAGLLLMSQVVGSMELSILLEQGQLIRDHDLYGAILALTLVGAFTKSAQFPFHFWLPNAMEAPTPVSAYLHSATMVKAGVYLLARLHPVLGGPDAWLYTVSSAGAVTMLLGAYLAWQQTDLKRILAYLTISVLGTLVLLLGIGTPIAVKAATVFLLAHSLYKGALFMTAGAIDHETGTRDISQLGGLGRLMPITATAAGLGALSMAAIPGFFGFVGKELVYEATLEADFAPVVLTALAVLANVFVVASAAILTIRPLLGALRQTPRKPHEAPFSMWSGPLLLGAIGLILGVLPGLIGKSLIQPAAVATLGQPFQVKLALWHGITPMLVLGGVTMAGGVLFYADRNTLLRPLQKLMVISRWGPARVYDSALQRLDALAALQTRALQQGYLRRYMLVIVVTTIGLLGYALYSRVPVQELDLLRTPWDIRLPELVLVAIILISSIVAVRARSRLAAVAALGGVGYGVALLYVLYSAPDLAMTQFSIETLTVILFVLVLYRLPPFTSLTGPRERLRDILAALTAGGLMALLVLAVTAIPADSRLTPYFAENSVPLAKGRNIVNVILVDFRGIDTLGEITVLSVAAVGVYALLKLRLVQAEEEE